MRNAILAMLACTACTGSPSSEAIADGETAVAETKAFSSQADVPSPDYAAMLKQPRPQPQPAESERKATAPLPPDAKAIGQLWFDRLSARNLLGGAGLAGKEPDGPVIMIDVLLTAREFDALVKGNGWSLPRHIDWTFRGELAFPAITDPAKDRVRMWPASTVRTGMQHMAALTGRVTLRDGCFFLRKFDGTEGLAWFLTETGLAVDPQGFLVLVNRATGEVNARIGEPLVWAGPNADPAPEATRELRKACGEHPVFEVGNPEAEAKFHTRYPHLRRPAIAPPPRKPR